MAAMGETDERAAAAPPPEPKPPKSGRDPGSDEAALARSAKEAFLVYDQLLDMRENVRHISDLTGIVAFVMQFNAKLEEVRDVVRRDPTILKSLQFLRPIDPDVSGSEYPSAIIDGKRGQFMVQSGVLMNGLKNFMRLYMTDADRDRLDATPILSRASNR